MSTAYAQTKRVENLHLTRERDRRRGRELATFLLVGLPVALALLAYAALHIETVRVGYMREARQRAIAQLNEESRRLRAELGRASAPERVAEVARREGLRPPRPGQVQIVDSRGAEPGGADRKGPVR
jgi:cell division protein FtsL